MKNAKTTTCTKGKVTIVTDYYFDDNGDVDMMHTSYRFCDYTVEYTVNTWTIDGSTSYAYHVNHEEYSYFSPTCDNIAEFVYYLVKQTRSRGDYEAETVLAFVNYMKW